MASVPPVTLFDEVLDFLAASPTPEQIIAFRPSPSLQAHASRLLERNQQQSLTAEEQTELDEFARMNHFMTMLKIRARKKLTDK